MKRKMALFVFFCIGLIAFHSCKRPMSMNTVQKEPRLIGVLYKIYEDIYLVDIDGTLTEVSRDAKLSDSPKSFMSGDVIRIYYDGTIEEGDPPKINTVYAFNQVSSSKIDDWIDAKTIEVQYISGSDKTEWTVHEKEALDKLYSWFRNQILLKEEFPEGESPADTDCEGIYHFELYNGHSTHNFSYYIVDEVINYLIYYDEWYRVEEPTMPFDTD